MPAVVPPPGSWVGIRSVISHSNRLSASASILREVITRSGQPVTASIKDYQLTIQPTIESGDRVRIEATFIESVSAPTAPWRLPVIVATNGQEASLTMGAYSFRFRPTLREVGP